MTVVCCSSHLLLELFLIEKGLVEKISLVNVCVACLKGEQACFVSERASQPHRYCPFDGLLSVGTKRGACDGQGGDLVLLSISSLHSRCASQSSSMYMEDWSERSV